jgi:cytochrome c biogenesis protein CcmG, thiol:disulfide interchange protein DsbE
LPYYKGVTIFKPLVVALAFLAVCGCTDSPRSGLVGRPAPDFTIQDSDRTVSLHQFRGKIVLLNLWGSWCEPCIEETPSLNRLQSRMGDRLVLLGVSMDTSDAPYHAFLKRYNVNFLTVRDVRQEAVNLYTPTGPPETYVIDRAGVIRRKFIGPQRWDGPELLDYLNKL